MKFMRNREALLCDEAENLFSAVKMLLDESLYCGDINCKECSNYVDIVKIIHKIEPNWFK